MNFIRFVLDLSGHVRLIVLQSIALCLGPEREEVVPPETTLKMPSSVSYTNLE